MTQALDTRIAGARAPVRGFSHDPGPAGEESPLQRLRSELDRMSAEERIRGSRDSFSRWERSIWAARYPEEVPLVNGEFEWIALSCE